MAEPVFPLPRYGDKTFLRIFREKLLYQDSNGDFDKKTFILDAFSLGVLAPAKAAGLVAISGASLRTPAALVGFNRAVEGASNTIDRSLVVAGGLASITNPTEIPLLPAYREPVEAFISGGVGLLAGVALVALLPLEVPLITAVAIGSFAGWFSSKATQSFFDFSFDTTQGPAIMASYADQIARAEGAYNESIKLETELADRAVRGLIESIRDGSASAATLRLLTETVKTINEFQDQLTRQFLISVLDINQRTADVLTKDAAVQFFNPIGSVELAKLAVQITADTKYLVENIYSPYRDAELTANQAVNSMLSSAVSVVESGAPDAPQTLAAMIPAMAKIAETELKAVSVVLSHIAETQNGQSRSDLVITAGVSTLVGTTASETLIGTRADETFDGKGGADKIIGGGGSDTFIYHQGYGALEIRQLSDAGVVSTLVTDLSSATQLSGSADRQGNLILTDGVSGDSIKLDNQLTTDGAGVQLIRFADGSSLSLAQIFQLGNAPSAGADILFGTAGPEIIDGLGGGDYINGQGGGDTFVFKNGYGALEIAETEPGTAINTLAFGAGITPAMITGLNDASGNLILRVGSTGDTIQLDGELLDPSRGVQRVTFADDTTTWNRTTLLSYASPATTGPDSIYTSPSGGTVDGFGGADTIHGIGGPDAIIYKSGYGSLTIDEQNAYGTTSAATLLIGGGITPQQTTVSITSNNLTLSFGGGTDSVTILNGAIDPRYGVAAVSFADGTRWGPVALQELGGAGQTSMLWRGTNNELIRWTILDGVITQQTSLAGVDQAVWKLVGDGHAASNGFGELIWQNTLGEVHYWAMQGNVHTTSGYIGTADPAYWKTAGYSDVAGAGQGDILLQGKGGEVELWTLKNNARISQSVIGNVGTDGSKTIAGFTEEPDNGNASILWQGNNGDLYQWQLHNGAVSSTPFIASTAGGTGAAATSRYWTVAGYAAEAAVQGQDDILMRGAAGETELWMVKDGALISKAQLGYHDPATWNVVSLSPTVRNGEADITWRSTTGDNQLWQVHAGAPTQEASLLNVDQYWKVVA